PAPAPTAAAALQSSPEASASRSSRVPPFRQLTPAGAAAVAAETHVICIDTRRGITLTVGKRCQGRVESSLQEARGGGNLRSRARQATRMGRKGSAARATASLRENHELLLTPEFGIARLSRPEPHDFFFPAFTRVSCASRSAATLSFFCPLKNSMACS